jgi:hypothetical protein
MQISINNILTFMRDKQNFNISQGQEEEIKDHFYKTARCLVYWSYYESNKVFTKLYQGTITREFYDYIKKLDKNERFCFYTPVDNYDEVIYSIKDLKFIEDPELIFFYLNSPNKEDDDLEGSIKGHRSDDE